MMTLVKVEGEYIELNKLIEILRIPYNRCIIEKLNITNDVVKHETVEISKDSLIHDTSIEFITIPDTEEECRMIMMMAFEMNNRELFEKYSNMIDIYWNIRRI